MADMNKPLLEVKNLKTFFKTRNGTVKAVNDVSYCIYPGKTLGIVGESGSGKSVSAMSVLRLLDANGYIAGGTVTFDGQDLSKVSTEQMYHIRGNRISVIFQEPMTSMDPVMRIGPQIEECLLNHRRLSKAQRRQLALEAMAQVELPEPERIYRKYPHELSGGMLQRVMIAAAIVSRPKLLLADEPTTALDVSVQAEILTLLKKLNRESGMAIMLISHDLHVVRKLCSRVAVMQRGKLVEDRSVEDIFRDPQHPYTQQLIAAIPGRDRHLF